MQSLPQLKSVTLSQFAKNTASLLPDSEKVSYQGSIWLMTQNGRSNDFLPDHITYNQNVSFSDYFVPDKAEFLNRELPISNKQVWYFPFWLLVGMGGIFLFKRYHMPWVGVIGFLFALCSYGLVLRSFGQFGWWVYFGPVVSNLAWVQIVLVLIGLGMGFLWWQLLKLTKIPLNPPNLLLIIELFGLDWLIQSARYTKLEGSSYVGFLTDPLRFVGFSWGKNWQFINQDFTPQVAGALLKFDFQKIWTNDGSWLVLYPLSHLIMALLLVFLYNKLPLGLRQIIFWLMGILWLGFLFNLLSNDPLYSLKNFT